MMVLPDFQRKVPLRRLCGDDTHTKTNWCRYAHRHVHFPNSFQLIRIYTCKITCIYSFVLCTMSASLQSSKSMTSRPFINLPIPIYILIKLFNKKWK